jgi:acyl-coenzyme A thioesterase PaaI-like protein
MTVDLAAEARLAAARTSTLAGRSGLELVAGLADESIRRPSMAETLPFTLLLPEEGKVRLVATPEPRLCNLTNTTHGGWIMTMLDTAMSLAAQTSLARRNLSIARNHRQVCPPDIPRFWRSARHRPCGFARADYHHAGGRIESAQGKLHAHGTSTSLVVSRKL